MMHKAFKIIFLLVFLLMVVSARGYAQDVRLSASVDSHQVALGSVVQLTLTLEGAQSKSPIELPDIEGFEARYVGPSTRVSIINGSYSSSVSYIYNLFPLKEGTWTIPSVSVAVNGQTLTTEPIDIKVVPAGTPVSSQSQGQNQSQVPQPSSAAVSSIGDQVFLTLEMPQREAYLYQKIPVVIKLYVGNLSIRDIQYPELDKTGFTMDEFQEPKQYAETLAGTRYDVVEFDTFFYPTRTGKLTIGPAQLSCNVMYKKSKNRRSPFGDFDNFFDDDFFNGFFDSYERYPYTVKSPDFTLNVLPLPEGNRPADFSGAVGRFDFEVSASPREVTEGDPMTLRMTISGEGSLNNVTMPALKATSDLKVYEPTIKQENGSKILEQVVIPQSTTVHELPAVSFSYFDSDEGTYKTITKGPFALTVKKSSSGQLKVISAPHKEESVVQETLGRDIVFIKEQPGSFKRKGTPFYNGGWFYALFVFLTFVFAGIYAFIRHRERIESDVHYAKRLRAPKKARAYLKEANGYLVQNRTALFYDTLFKTLQEYLGGKFRIPPGIVTAKAVEERLKQNNLNETVLKNLKEILEVCDSVRYAALARTGEQIREDLKKTEKIIDYFERVRL